MLNIKIESLNLEFDKIEDNLIRKINLAEKRFLKNKKFNSNPKYRLSDIKINSQQLVGILYNEYDNYYGLKYSEYSLKSKCYKTNENDEFVTNFFRNNFI